MAATASGLDPTKPMSSEPPAIAAITSAPESNFRQSTRPAELLLVEAVGLCDLGRVDGGLVADHDGVGGSGAERRPDQRGRGQRRCQQFPLHGLSPCLRLLQGRRRAHFRRSRARGTTATISDDLRNRAQHLRLCSSFVVSAAGMPPRRLRSAPRREGQSRRRPQTPSSRCDSLPRRCMAGDPWRGRPMRERLMRHAAPALRHAPAARGARRRAGRSPVRCVRSSPR